MHTHTNNHPGYAWRAEFRECGFASRWWVLRGPGHGLPLDNAGDYTDEAQARAEAERLNSRMRVRVGVGDRWYIVNLDNEHVWAQVHMRHAWREVRVSSKRIETAAILRASDKWHAEHAEVQS